MTPIRKEFLEKIREGEMLEIVQLLSEVERFGLTTEVVYTALEEMKSNPNTSILLSLQIAAKDWDVV
tara:strand:- start:124 stop:324 length:201 start_codon:yes stop_codon:yes gene_type:complete